MKHLSLTLCLALSVSLLSSAYANHRTGSLILPELIVAGDFNQDGKIDLAVNATGFDNVAVLFGDGSGGFTLGGHFAVDTLPKGLQVGDVNRDGRLDLVTCNNWGYSDTVLLGDGRGAFHSISPPNEIEGDGEPVRLLMRDFNKDGRLDLATNAPDENKVILFLGDGRGGFPAPDIEIEGVKSPFGMDSGDLNGDGNLDMLVLGPTRAVGKSVISILLGDGTGNFALSVIPVGDSPSSVQTGDLNHDGFLDFVLAGAEPENTTGNFLATYLGDGTGNFTLQQTIPLGKGSSKGEIAVGDFNEDGALDVAFPQTSLQDRRRNGTKVLLYFGDGTGKLTEGPALKVGQEPHTVIAVDVNADQHLDLAVSNRTDGTIECLLGNGIGKFVTSSTTSVLSSLP
ncbi:MAG: VCBS repeat-containing protein [Verrucomicrobiota bacterium]|nr:VCBS repeat-containing protein [Verrucomicrobiota bacterium]